MEEEISLKEIIAVLWQGRYLIIGITAAAMIIAFVFSFFFTTPLYRATAYLDLDEYDQECGIEELMRRPDQSAFLKGALEDLVTDSEGLAESVELAESQDYEGYLEVVAAAPEPGLAAEATNQIGLDLLRWADEYELEQLKAAKESNEESLDFFDKQLKGTGSVRSFNHGDNEDSTPHYVKASIDVFDEKLQIKKESLEKELENFDQYILDAFGESSPRDLETRMLDRTLINPAYQTVMEKKGALLTKLFEVEYAKEKLKQGELPDISMAEGTVFETTVTRRNALQSNIMDLSLRISRVEYAIAHLDQERYLHEAPVPREPFNIRWPLNTAVAGVLGLMLSVFIVFIRPHITELVSEIKKADQAKDQQ